MMETLTRLGESGRLVIPATMRRELELHAGDEVILRIEDGSLHLYTRRKALERAQAAVRDHMQSDRSLADELIADRRQELAGEEE